MRNLLKSADPIELFNKGISWEEGNTSEWITADSNLPNNKKALPFLFTFNVLAATYLLIGRYQNEVEVPWALNLFRTLNVDDVVLTFNWDVIPEALMTRLGKPFCRYDWTKNRTKMIKLHGSVDLFSDPNYTMKYDLEDNPRRFECVTDKLWRVRTAGDVLVRTKPFPSGRLLEPTERYSNYATMIMTPYSIEGYGFRLIQFNWRKAMTALERAKEIYVIGYSIPQEDKVFRSLIERVRDNWTETLTIDIWNRNRDVEERAKTLFGNNRTVFHRAPAAEFRFH